MKKTITLFLILLSFCSLAQQNEIGIRSGMHYDVHTFSSDHHMFHQMLDGLKPSVELYYTHTNNKGVFYGTGLSYRSVTLNPSIYLRMSMMETIYRVISVPFRIGCSFNISEKLYTNISFGIDFAYNSFPENGGIGFNVTGQDSIYYEYSIGITNKLERDINLFLSNSIELKYKAKWGLRLGLFCNYYSGLFEVWDSDTVLIKLTNKYTGVTTTYYPTITNRGSSLVFGLSMAWAFGK